MTTNRRGFLKTALAGLASALVPSWLITEKRPSYSLDLSAFCDRRPWLHPRYSIGQPFVQQGIVDDEIGPKPWQQKLGLPGSHWELFRYATDGRVCVRVPIHPGDVFDSEKIDLPPAYSLAWTHEWPKRGKWFAWPQANYLLAADSDCPRCFGTGDMSGLPEECEVCDGTGHEWVGSSYDLCRPIECRTCGGLGSHIETRCPDCHGKPIGTYPSIQRLPTGYIASEYHAKVASLPGVEYFVPATDDEIGERPVQFRFTGGHGLLMRLNIERAEARMKEALE